MNNRLANIHPGEILLLEFLEPMNITPYRLSKDIGVAQTRISEILALKRSITADTALRLSRYFGNMITITYFPSDRFSVASAWVYIFCKIPDTLRHILLNFSLKIKK